MDVVLLAARILLAAVLAVAGATKLADRTGSRQAVIDFGLPAALAGPLGRFVPLAELAAAALLLPVATAWWGGLGALALLLAFTVGIVVNLARGRRPECRCFGQLHSEPVGWPTLVRNGVLASVAGFVVWQGRADPGASAVAWLGDLTTAERVALLLGVASLVLLAAVAWLLIQLLGQSGRVLLRLDNLEARLAGRPMPAIVPATPAPLPELGLPLGAPAPAFSLASLRGEALTLDDLRGAGKPVLLLFSDPGCSPCNALLPEVGRWQRDHAGVVTLAVVGRGNAKANRAKSTEHGLTRVLLQRDYEVAEAYRASGTPSAVLVRPDGTIGSAVAPGADAIRALVARTVGLPVPLAPATGVNGTNGAVVANGTALAPGAPAVPAAPRPGQRAPALTLPDLAGEPVALARPRGEQTLLLFWDPRCGFCARMLDDLKTWEAAPRTGAPKLLVVSTGTVEENRAMGLRSPVVLDQGFRAGQAFGAGGTPSAVLIDAKGDVASEVAVGAPAVLALAHGGQTPPTPTAAPLPLSARSPA
jgi:peroxiredoxin